MCSKCECDGFADHCWYYSNLHCIKCENQTYTITVIVCVTVGLLVVLLVFMVVRYKKPRLLASLRKTFLIITDSGTLKVRSNKKKKNWKSLFNLFYF